MSSIGLDPVEAADFADHVARTPGTPLDDPWFTGSTIASPLMGLATGAANLSFLAEEAATPVLRPFAETLDKQFGTSGAAWLDEQQRLSREQIVRQQEISPRVFGKAGDMVRGLVQYGTEATAGTVVGGLTGFAAGATTGNPWIAAAGTIAGAPAGAVAVTGLAEALPRYYKLLSEGVDPDTAKSLAGIEGLVAGGTALLPLHAKTGGYLRSFGHGAALMAEMNAFQRGATHEILDNAGYHDMAEQYKFLDAQAILTDAVMGGLFGVIGHAMHGAPPGEQNPTLADAPLVDSVARDREARGPGIPADPYTRDANQAAIEKSIDDTLQGNPVDVSKEIDPERAKFVADPHDEEFRVQAKQVADEIVGPLPADQPGGGEPPIAPVTAEHPLITALAEHRDDMRAFTDASNTVPIDQLVSTKDESADPRVVAGTKLDPRLTAAKFMVKSLTGETAARVPLKVERRPDGKLQVIDGNATVQAARLAGWTKIPVEIVKGEAPMVPTPDDANIAKLAPEQQIVLRKMYDKAAELKPAFDKSIEDIAAEVGGKAKTTDLKGTERAVEKIIAPDEYNGDASRVKDLLRATVEVPHISDVPKAIAELYRRFKDAPGTHSRNGLDPAVETTEDGYRDFKMNAIIDGHVTEIQINVPQMLEAKDRLHKYYKERAKLVRDNPEFTPEQTEKFNELSRLMREGYDEAWRDALDTSARNTASVTGEPLRMAESQLKGRGEASSYAVAEGALPSLPAEGGTRGETTTGTPSTLKNLEPAGKDLGSVTTPTSIAETMPAGKGRAPRELEHPSTMTPGKINKEMARLEAQRSAIGDELIAAGRGSEKPSERRGLTDELTLRERTVEDRYQALRDEIRNRTGSDYGKMPAGFKGKPREAIAPGEQAKQQSLEREVQAALTDNPTMEIPTKTGELVPAHDAITAADQQITEAAKAPDMLDAAINCDRKAA